MSTAHGFWGVHSNQRITRACLAAGCVMLLGACAAPRAPASVDSSAQLTPATPSMRDLMRLPPPSSRVAVAVYGFRDQTGQYKQQPDSDFSTAVTQGAASMLVKALKDSGWFMPVEREGLQELLTERRIVRAINEPATKGPQPQSQPQSQSQNQLPSLMPASILIEGGITAYDTNVRTGGAGAAFLGIGLSTQYRVDQVTVDLRSVDVNSGAVMQSVSTTKTILSYEVSPSVFKFVAYKELLQIEAGVTGNEPAQLCVKEAINAAVMHLAVQGLKDHTWALKNPNDWNAPIIQQYLREEEDYASGKLATPAAPPAVPSQSGYERS